MGRYYSGDIEGKFRFGVQSSDDAEFFGAFEEEPCVINYQVPREDGLEEGITKCIEALGENRDRMDQFWSSLKETGGGYNKNIVADFWKNEFNVDITEKEFSTLNEWDARLALGLQMKKFFEDHPEADEIIFSAEL